MAKTVWIMVSISCLDCNSMALKAISEKPDQRTINKFGSQGWCAHRGAYEVEIDEDLWEGAITEE